MFTKNGGSTWETIVFPEDEHFFGAYMPDEMTIVVGSASGKVIASHDQGVTWDTIIDGLGQITDLAVIDHTNIVVSSENGNIYRTTDFGKT